MANNYKIKMKDIQNKYKFKIFCAGYEYDDTELRNEISQRALISEAGRYVELELNPNTYVLTAKLKDKNNNVISTSTPIDLPLESMIVDCDYDATTKSLIITLQNGNTISIPLSDLISGLATEEDLEEVDAKVDANIAKISDLENELNQYKTIYNVLPKINGSGESITLNNTANAVMKNKLYPSEMSQEGTPTSDTPQPIHTISGDNTFNFSGKNLWDESILNQYKDSEDSEAYIFNNYTLYNKNLTPNIKFKPNTKYTIQYVGKQVSGNPRLVIVYTDGTKDAIGEQTIATTYTKYTQASKYNNKTIDYISQEFGSNGVNTFYIKKDSLCIVEGEDTTYEPYQSQSKPLNLGDLEYNAIGDYKDEFVKIDGKWYLRKNIGKIVLDGTQNVSNVNASSTNTSRVAMYSRYNYVSSNILCDKLILNSGIWSQDVEGIYFARSGNDQTKGDLYFRINKSLIGTTIESYNAYVRQNNIIIYMPIVSTDIPLNETLQEQIEDIYNQTLAYQGQTNISQVNNDLAFIVESSALKDLSNL